jgi:AraC family transcriptional activator of pobA
MTGTPMLTAAPPFKTATIREGMCQLTNYNRRDFYKITVMLNGATQLCYANRAITVQTPALVFTNPMIPYSWELDEGSDLPDGFFCVFTEEFIKTGNRSESLSETALFKPGGNPIYFLNEGQVSYIQSLFARMHQEFAANYVYKYDLLRNLVQLIIHEAVKMQPAIGYHTPSNAAARITSLFTTLLHKQFPVESPRHPLRLKKASDYAAQLSVHVNHLNAAVQQVTGKSTTTHINEQLVAEAKLLLTNTDWSINEIAASLGFEYASYFNNFFKRLAGVTPMAFRKLL